MDPLRGRVGNVVLVRGGSLIAAAGLGIALLVHEPAAGIAGFALLGLGLAPVVPIAFSAAGDLDARATGRLVGRVATVGYVGSVAGPIMIGWLAEATSLRVSLGLVVVLALVIAVSARRGLASGAHELEDQVAEIPTLFVCHGDDGGPRVHPCRRVQEALRASGIEYDKVVAAHGNPIPFLRKGSRDDLRDATGSTKLPALKLPDGTVITHSRAILSWVDEQPGQQ